MTIEPALVLTIEVKFDSRSSETRKYEAESAEPAAASSDNRNIQILLQQSSTMDVSDETATIVINIRHTSTLQNKGSASNVNLHLRYFGRLLLSSLSLFDWRHVRPNDRYAEPTI